MVSGRRGPAQRSPSRLLRPLLLQRRPRPAPGKRRTPSGNRGGDGRLGSPQGTSVEPCVPPEWPAGWTAGTQGWSWVALLQAGDARPAAGPRVCPDRVKRQPFSGQNPPASRPSLTRAGRGVSTLGGEPGRGRPRLPAPLAPPGAHPPSQACPRHVPRLTQKAAGTFSLGTRSAPRWTVPP